MIPLGIKPHNHHFLWAATIKTEQKAFATQAANDTAGKVKLEMLREAGFNGTLQHLQLIPFYTRTLFGEWDSILKEPAPAVGLLYPRGIWHYARGMALFRKGETDSARHELAQLEKKIVNDPAIAKLSVFDLTPVTSLL